MIRFEAWTKETHRKIREVQDSKAPVAWIQFGFPKIPAEELSNSGLSTGIINLLFTENTV